LSSHDNETPHTPSPSLWPIGFAIGIAVVLTGLVVSTVAAVVGAVIAIVFGFLWIRDVTRPVRTPAPEVEPETRSALTTSEASADGGEEEEATYGRNAFLAASTLGLGAVIGGVITLPVLGFAVLPSFTNQHDPDIDLGPIDQFPEGQFVIATFLENPEIGEVSRRTMFIRNNGRVEDVPSFTVLYSRCVHLGCPVQPNGPIFDDQKVTYEETVDLTPVLPAGFGCPCHGGQYDTEGNRTAGPPVRALDRYAYDVRNGRLFLVHTYSVSTVDGEGKDAIITRYDTVNPGIHVDGLEQFLYPLNPPQ